MTKVYYDGDADLTLLKGKKVAIIGYGSQGHAQAQNLRDSGIDVVVAELEGTKNYEIAFEHGFKPTTAKSASQQADIVQILAPENGASGYELTAARTQIPGEQENPALAPDRNTA